jgi:ribonuclease HII
MFALGIDENGLGPRLGPMIVTAVMAEIDERGARVIARKARGGLAQRLGDSKGLVAHGNVTLAETWTRALVARGAGRATRGDCPDALVDAVALDDRAALTFPCPDGLESQCWNVEGERFEEDDDTRALRRTIDRDLDRLEKRGVRIAAVRSVIACTKRMNDDVDRGHSRFVTDLHAMERLILALRERSGEELDVVCGKVGGFGSYGKVFGPLAGRLHVVLEEGRARSAYRFPSLGTIAFVRDADERHLLVGLASLVGKYLRELLMARIVRHYQAADPQLGIEHASGYHDPVTTRFMVATEALRQKRRVPDDCFVRRKLGE